ETDNWWFWVGALWVDSSYQLVPSENSVILLVSLQSAAVYDPLSAWGMMYFGNEGVSPVPNCGCEGTIEVPLMAAAFFFPFHISSRPSRGSRRSQKGAGVETE